MFQAIRAWRENSTTIVITHDLSQITPDDFVYVMKDGLVVEQGFRRDLIKLGGTFTDMANEQSVVPLPVKLDFSWREVEEDTLLAAEDVEQAGADMDALARLHTTTFRMSMRPQSSMPAKRHAPMESVYSRPRLTSLTRTASVDRSTSMLHRPLTMGGSAQGPAHPFAAVGGRNWRASTQSLPHLVFQQRHFSTASIPSKLSVDEKDSFDVPAQETHDRFEAREVSKSRRRALPSKAKGSWRKNKAEAEVEEEPQDVQEEKVYGFFRLMWRFLPSIPHKLLLIFGIISSVGRGVATPVWSFFLAQLMSLLGSGNNAQVRSKSLILVGIVLGQALVVFAQHASLASLGAIWTAKLRDEGYTLVLKQDKKWYDEEDNSPPRILQGLIKDVDDMRHLVATILPRALVAVFMVALGFTWAMAVGWQLTLVGLGLLPLFGVIGAFSSIALSKAEVYNKAQREAVSRLFFEVSSPCVKIKADRSLWPM